MVDLYTRAHELLNELRRNGNQAQGVDMRAYWRGQSFEGSADQPMTIRRALALQAVLQQCQVVIRPQDVIVGAPSGTVLPERPANIDDVAWERLHALNTEIGERSFWQHVDHCAPDYETLLSIGLDGLIARIDAAAYPTSDQRVFAASMRLALGAASDFVMRHAHACRTLAQEEKPVRAAELAGIVADCERVAHHPPQSFRQAVQLVWLLHVIWAIEGRGAMAFGRLDQYLLPFYLAEPEAERDARTKEVLGCMWAKLEEPGLPNSVQNIAIGGTTPSGDEAVNPLSYLILDVTRAMSTPHSNLSARVTSKSGQFLLACADVIKTGIGFPSLFNDDVLILAICEHLKIPLEDARDYCFVGCIETQIQGCVPPWSDSMISMSLALEHTLLGGASRLPETPAGDSSPDPRSFASFEDLYQPFEAHLTGQVERHIAQLKNVSSSADPARFTSPLLSALTRDCIARGRDINDGGARYPDLHGIAGMGLGTVSDSLAAIRWFIYDHAALSWDKLLTALADNFCHNETLHQRLLHQAPKYGNDTPYVDELAARVVRTFTDLVLAQRSPTGGYYVPLMAANINNIRCGAELGASPDGRLARQPVSDAASPSFGRDLNGPTAVIKSLTQVDYKPVVGGTVVNLKFSPSALAGKAGSERFRALMEAYFERGGMQMQFNVTGRQTLEAARAHPEDYRDLVVRVSGLSSFYVELSPSVQEDILACTEHE
ncbi:MAG: hypothetical protein GXY52_07060 [Chloroflexi bacterium]|nr:hypothetical protein [Chloroflexota bacterium]